MRATGGSAEQPLLGPDEKALKNMYIFVVSMKYQPLESLK